MHRMYKLLWVAHVVETMQSLTTKPLCTEDDDDCKISAAICCEYIYER